MLNWETATLFAQHYRGRNMISPDVLNWETAMLFAQLYRGRRSISPAMLNWEMSLHYVGAYLLELAAVVVDSPDVSVEDPTTPPAEEFWFHPLCRLSRRKLWCHMRRLFATSWPLWTKR
jgi:hypothetical protein